MQDNKNFITDSQLFNEDFMGLMRSIFKAVGGDLCMTTHRYKHEYMRHFEMLKRESLDLSKTIIFDMLAYYDKNNAL